MKKLSENLFAPAFDRSRTGEKRREDDINRFKRNDLFNYIVNHYEYIDHKCPDPINDYFFSSISFTPLAIKYHRYRTYLYFDDDNYLEKISQNIPITLINDIDKIFGDQFRVEKKSIGNSTLYQITDKDGNVSNQIAVDLIDRLIETSPDPIMRKRT